MNPAQAYTIMFFTGGFLYCALEILMRGYSHISMLLAGGICCRHDRESLSASGGMGLFRTAVQLSGADLSFIL